VRPPALGCWVLLADGDVGLADLLLGAEGVVLECGLFVGADAGVDRDSDRARGGFGGGLTAGYGGGSDQETNLRAAQVVLARSASARTRMMAVRASIASSQP
jgi:hypothetical protein